MVLNQITFQLVLHVSKERSCIGNNASAYLPFCPSGRDETERQHPGWVWCQEWGPGIQESGPGGSKYGFTSIHTDRKSYTHTPCFPLSLLICLCPPVIFPEIRCNKVKHGVRPVPQGHHEPILRGGFLRGLSKYPGSSVGSHSSAQQDSAVLSGNKSCQYYFTL